MQAISAPLTAASVLVLQRSAGNRATRELLGVQRTKEDAARYARQMRIMRGSVLTADNVEAFIEDEGNDRGDRKGLLEAWNRGLGYWERIPTPRSLGGDEPTSDPMEGVETGSDSTGVAQPAPARRRQKRDRAEDDAIPRRPAKRSRPSEPWPGGLPDYSSSADEEANRLDYDSDKDQSDAFEEKTRIQIKRYRREKVRMTFTGSGYGATSTANANFVLSKGARDTRYRSLFPRLIEIVKSDAGAADLMLKGLLDMPAFHRAVADYQDPKERHTIQQFLALLFNEILGRSTANLVDVVALLSHTVKKDDDQLTRRFFDRGLFIPSAKEHEGFGGSKLSKIGSANRGLKLTDLDEALQLVVQRNRQMYASMYKHSGVDSRDAFKDELKGLVTRFGDNFMKYVELEYLGPPVRK